MDLSITGLGSYEVRYLEAKSILSPTGGFIWEAGFTHSLSPARNCTYFPVRKIGVLRERTDSPRGGFGRGGGPPLPVGPAGRAPRLRSFLASAGAFPANEGVRPEVRPTSAHLSMAVSTATCPPWVFRVG
jgi:hypothetical protein